MQTAAPDSLKAALDAHLSKSSIQIESPTSIPAEDQSAYSAKQTRDLEDEHRTQYTSAQGATIWAYAIVLDGESIDEKVLGIAYYNTSMAFFGKTIDDITGGVTQPSREKVEGTVFLHEFGHRLGLVNNGTPMQQDHHDEANGAYCTNDQCIMHHSIETTDDFANVFDRTMPDFEQFCTEDMAAQRGQ